MALEPGDVEVGDNSVKGEVLDGGCILGEATTPLIEAAIADLGQDIGTHTSPITNLAVTHTADVVDAVPFVIWDEEAHEIKLDVEIDTTATGAADLDLGLRGNC